jgi:hypothetical protein
MKFHLLPEDEIEKKLEQLNLLQTYVGEYNIPCDVELVGDNLIVQMYSGESYLVNDEILNAMRNSMHAFLCQACS